MTARTRRDWTAAWTAMGPGLGHLPQGRTRAGALFAGWTPALAAFIPQAPAAELPRGPFVAGLPGAGLLALAGVLRP